MSVMPTMSCLDVRDVVGMSDTFAVVPVMSGARRDRASSTVWPRTTGIVSEIWPAAAPTPLSPKSRLRSARMEPTPPTTPATWVPVAIGPRMPRLDKPFVNQSVFDPQASIANWAPFTSPMPGRM